MAFQVFHLDDAVEVNPPLESFAALYDELHAGTGQDFESVCVMHDSGWAIDATRDGLIRWWRAGSFGSWFMRRVSRLRVLNLWRLLADGETDAIERKPWQRGDGFVRDPKQQLTGDQMKRGKEVYRILGKLLGMRHSKFEVVHLRRGEPEEMVRHWERIALAFQRYTTEQQLNQVHEQNLLDNLREIAFDGAKAVAAGHRYWDELLAVYSSTEQAGTSAGF